MACDWTPVGFGEPPEVEAECTPLLGVEEAPPVTIRVTNDGDAVAYLAGPMGCDSTRMLLEDASGRRYPDDRCISPCEVSLVEECGCLANCPFPLTVAIQPGATYSFPWTGVMAEIVEASEQCAGSCAGECRRAVAPQPGPMQVIVALRSQAQCGEEDECECVANDEGWCTLNQTSDADIQLVEREIDWPPPCPVIEIALP